MRFIHSPEIRINKQPKVKYVYKILKQPKILTISFCITCMGRLAHLKQTLSKNLYDTRNYKKREFVVINYNSRDGLHNWINNNFKDELKSGLLKYYRTVKPSYFHMSHAKNMAHRLASGDIVCNVDADNFLGEEFCGYLNERFVKHVKVITLTGHFGKLALYRKDFMKLGGYDERFIGWGHEDGDLYKRAQRMGLWSILDFNDSRFKRRIEHSNSIRAANFSVGLSKSVVHNQALQDENDRKNVVRVNLDYEWGVDDFYGRRYNQ